MATARPSTPRRGAPCRRQRGLSIVELLVGVAIGLIVVAAASLVVATQLSENRKLLLETQVRQDLRATADIVTRELRRTGAWNAPHQGVWYPGSPGVARNPYDTVTVTTLGTDADQVVYAYFRQTGSAGPYGFKLEGNVLKSSLDGLAYQELSDPRTLRVTNFTVTPVATNATPGPNASIPCPKLCPDGTQACWPTLNVRELDVVIEGQSVSDPSITRRLETRVRLRNDQFIFYDPATAQFCPP